MWNIFKQKHAPYNFRNKMLTNLPSAKSTTYGTNSVVFKGSLIWNSLSNLVNDSPTLAIFSKKIQKWNGHNCNLCN